MKILIITGGTSSERKISLISARTMKGVLQSNNHSVALFDFKKDYTKLKKTLQNFDVIFPIMHGKEGEDGTLYRFLRSAKKRYVGSDPRGAKIASNKILFKKYCAGRSVSSAPWKRIKTTRDISRFGFPCMLKAASGGSSHEVAPLCSKRDLSKTFVKKILKLNSPLFVEKLLAGTEITVGVVLGHALPVIEIIPPNNSWFNYKNKYSGKTKEIPFAPSVSRATQRRAQKIALQIHHGLHLGSFSRTDFIVEGGVPYVLEINTPGGVGLTPQSLLPKAAKAAGISFRQLAEMMLKGSI